MIEKLQVGSLRGTRSVLQVALERAIKRHHCRQYHFMLCDIERVGYWGSVDADLTGYSQAIDKTQPPRLRVSFPWEEEVIMPASQKPSDTPAVSESVETMEGLDPADPHPAEEGDPYNTQHPDGVHPHSTDIGPNPARHDGNPPPRPDNVETDGKR